MLKSIIAALALISLTASAAPAESPTENDDWTEDAKAYITAHEDADDPASNYFQNDQGESDIQLLPIQWHRTWTCFARSRNGRVFSGTSSNPNVARRIALNRCFNRSWGCFSRGCR